MTWAGPWRNATPSEHFLHSSHCIFHTPDSTNHTCASSQLISSKLFSSHFMSSHMSAKFFLAIFISSDHSSTFLILQPIRWLSFCSQPVCSPSHKACTKYFPVLLCTLHRRLQSLYAEKCKVSCSGFLPKTNPVHHSCSEYTAFHASHAAITMRFASTRSWQQSCSQLRRSLLPCVTTSL